MFYQEEKSSIKYFKSSIFNDSKFVHAFTTRINDFSMAMTGIPELEPYILKNREKICSVLELDYRLIVTPDQQHTDNIKIINSMDEDLSATDGIITSSKSLVLMLLFADCTPIILYAPKEQVIGVIHAGWRGTAKKIAQKAINLFTNDFNVYANTIKAAIGPAIGQCCYPVSQETAFELRKSIDENHANIFKENNNQVKVDLKKLNAQQLKEAGVLDIDIINKCTSCNNSLFYSYRAEEGKTGRHAAIASLN